MFVCGCELREGEELRGTPCAVLSVNPQFFPFLVLGCFEGLRVLGGTDKTDVVSGLYSLQIKLTDGNRQSAGTESSAHPDGRHARHTSCLSARILNSHQIPALRTPSLAPVF